MCVLRLNAHTAKKVFDSAFQKTSLCSDQLLDSRIFRCIQSGGAYTTSFRSSSNSSVLSNLCQTIVIRKSSTFKRNFNKMLNHLPYFASGEIVRGFGRGSSELGIPTANFSLEVVKSLPAAFTLGIYYGWANVDNGEVYKMVMSIGTNPYYDNKEKSMETHIMHKFDGDLYGHQLKVCIVGYLRPERNFDSLEDLINAIQKDIKEADDLLDKDVESRELQHSKFFKTNCNESRMNSTTTHLNSGNVKNDSS